MTHTPTPWSIFPEHDRTPDEPLRAWVGRQNKHAARIECWGGDYEQEPEAQSNARLIVTAVNSHETLTNAISLAIEDIDDWINPQGDYAVTTEGLRALVRQLRAALALAEPDDDPNGTRRR